MLSFQEINWLWICSKLWIFVRESFEQRIDLFFEHLLFTKLQFFQIQKARLPLT